MAREGKGKSMGSYNNGNPPGDEPTSLAARRARLRGSLAKAAMPDEPYGGAAASSANDPQTGQPAQSAASVPEPDAQPAPPPPPAPTPPKSALQQLQRQTMPGAAQLPPPPLPEDLLAPAGSDYHSAAPPFPFDLGNPGQPAGPLAALLDLTSPSVAHPAPPVNPLEPAAAAANPPLSELAPTPPANPPEPAAAAANPPAPELAPAVSAQEIKYSPPAEIAAPVIVQPVAIGPVQAEFPPAVIDMLADIHQSTNACASNLAALQAVSQMTASAPQAIPQAVTDLLSNIDSALNASALNLSALQKIADEQTEVLRNLSDTLKNQTLYEIGLNLNSLTESLTAALEPMKAAGELVPAIDQLVASMEAKAAVDKKYSPDQLVMNLSDQLSAGTIDPWTFKCAYMAIFPTDHPADLLRRLVELLGTQRLSGDLFRAAYEAVQAAEPPPRPASMIQIQAHATGGGESGSRTVYMDDPETKAQLEALRAANEEMRKAIEERENEFEQLLAAKDMELQEAQEMLNSRYEEFNTRYAELTEALNKREEEYQNLLENKDMELTEKESESNLLRHQMEELRGQMEEIAKELQSQTADIRIAKEAANNNPTLPSKPPSSGGFFDSAPPAKPSSLFDAAPAEKPFFAEPAQTAQPQQQAPPAPVPQPQPAPAPVPAPAMPPPQAPQPSQSTTQSMTRTGGPATTTPFTSGTGSYGSGVRAQVFEVIVRQALAGAPWREICAGPMQVNNITPDEVEAEVRRRQAMLNK